MYVYEMLVYGYEIGKKERKCYFNRWEYGNLVLIICYERIFEVVCEESLDGINIYYFEYKEIKVLIKVW